MCEMACQIVQKKLEEKQTEEEQADKAQNSNIPACCDDEDDYNFAITPNEPIDSLSMGDEHLNTIPAMESDEFIKSCVENLVPNPSESDGENGCDQEKRQIEEEQVAKAQNSKITACCDDDDDYNFAITPNQPVDPLSMGDEHLDTILKTESDEFIKTSFRKHKVVVITDEPMEKILKLFGREGRLEKWVAEIRTYDISYIQRKEAEGSVVKKLFGQGEQVQKTPCAMKEKRPT
nr:hypothetical protein [Tanacetum cinerariifolium]